MAAKVENHSPYTVEDGCVMRDGQIIFDTDELKRRAAKLLADRLNYIHQLEPLRDERNKIGNIQIVWGYSQMRDTYGQDQFTPHLDGKDLRYVAESEDVAILLALGAKYDRQNAREFARFACRMLGIESEWAK